MNKMSKITKMNKISEITKMKNPKNEKSQKWLKSQKWIKSQKSQKISEITKIDKISKITKFWILNWRTKIGYLAHCALFESLSDFDECKKFNSSQEHFFQTPFKHVNEFRKIPMLLKPQKNFNGFTVTLWKKGFFSSDHESSSCEEVSEVWTEIVTDQIQLFLGCKILQAVWSLKNRVWQKYW